MVLRLTYLGNLIPFNGLFQSGLLCLVLTFCYLGANAQTGLNVFGKMKVDKSTVDQAHLTISKDGEPFKSGGVEKNGKFDFILQINHVYLFTFAKPGYVTKKILIDTHIPREKEGTIFNPFEFIVTVFDQNESQNTYAYNQPVARIHYSEFIEEFDYDTDYTKSMQARFDAEKAAEKEKEKAIEPTIEKEDSIAEINVEEPKTETVKVISSEEGTIVKEDIAPTVDVDKRSRIKAKADADKRTVIRPGVAIDDKPNRKPVPIIIAKSVTAPYVAGSDPKPNALEGMYKHKTIDKFRENRMNVTITTFIIEEDVIVYKKVVHDWGGIFYFKDGNSISPWSYESEVSEYTDKE